MNVSASTRFKPQPTILSLKMPELSQFISQTNQFRTSTALANVVHTDPSEALSRRLLGTVGSRLAAPEEKALAEAAVLGRGGDGHAATGVRTAEGRWWGHFVGPNFELDFAK